MEMGKEMEVAMEMRGKEMRGKEMEEAIKMRGKEREGEGEGKECKTKKRSRKEDIRIPLSHFSCVYYIDIDR